MVEPGSGILRGRAARGWILELAIVTVGVLIALVLGGLVEWAQHRSLAQEARVNVRAEIRQNQDKLKRFVESSRRSAADRQTLRQFIDDLTQGKPVKVENPELEFTLTVLTSAAWQTAAATGALAYMPYAEVRNYAQLYDVQNRFEALQGEYLRVFGQTTMHGMDPTKMTAVELQDWKRQLSGLEASMRTQLGIAGVLLRDVYPKFLAGPEP